MFLKVLFFGNGCQYNECNSVMFRCLVGVVTVMESLISLSLTTGKRNGGEKRRPFYHDSEWCHQTNEQINIFPLFSAGTLNAVVLKLALSK